MKTSIFLILIYVVLNTIANIFLKLGMKSVGEIDIKININFLNIIFKSILNPFIFSGIIMMGIGIIVWLILLSRESLNYAFSLAALVYIFIPIASNYYINETISFDRWIGNSILFVGLIIVFISK